MAARQGKGASRVHSTGSSRRFVALVLFFAALNAAGIWWIQEAVRPRAGVRVTRVTPSGESPATRRVVGEPSAEAAPVDSTRDVDPNRLVRIVPSVEGSARWSGRGTIIFEAAKPL